MARPETGRGDEGVCDVEGLRLLPAGEKCRATRGDEGAFDISPSPTAANSLRSQACVSSPRWGEDAGSGHCAFPPPLWGGIDEACERQRISGGWVGVREADIVPFPHPLRGRCRRQPTEGVNGAEIEIPLCAPAGHLPRKGGGKRADVPPATARPSAGWMYTQTPIFPCDINAFGQTVNFSPHLRPTGEFLP
jgi:hypothetical protein